MGDSAEIVSPAAESVSLYRKSRLSTETLDRSSSYRRPKMDVHASAHKLFDKLAQEDKSEEPKLSESKHEEDYTPLMSTEVLEDSDEPLISPSRAEASTLSEPLSPVVGDDNGDSIDDETDAWISCNQSESEGCKQLPSIASSSSSWHEDVYEKPSMVGAGLANLGNTCFFNAVLQCFTHSVLLLQGLYSFNHQTPCDCGNEWFCLICALREHVELSLSSNESVVSPWKFVNNLSYFSSAFQRFQQEDAHEFLQCFLDRLESRLINLKLKDINPSSQSDNLVKQVFGGRVISKLTCCNCNHISDTYEPSVDLSLEIDDANTLLTALESFTKVEHIGDEEMKFTCDECKQKVSVKKQLMLDQTPPICAFHLKRFKNDGSYVEKIDKHVEFPLELDLQPYTCGSQVDLRYELYAVVVHTAFSSSFGHYYCYIRSAPDTWYKFDDSKVSRVSEAYVLSEEAYILFYTKQDTPWFSSFLETYKPLLDHNLSNTSPKSVLENMDPPNINKSDVVDPPNINKSDVVGPHKPIINVNKPTPLLTLKEYGSNHMVEVEKNNGLTPTRPNGPSGINSENGSSGVFSVTFERPSDFKTTMDVDQVASPSTPPRSHGFDLSDDEISDTEVVFAQQLKVVEKPTNNKRPRIKEVEDSAKQEAFRQCKKMPGARGSLLMAAMSSPKSDNSLLKKKTKKMTSSPRKNYSKSSERFKHHNHNSFTRSLATSR